MAMFMDVHDMAGVTKEALADAHRKDLEVEKGTGVHFSRYWADTKKGKVFCLSEGPNREAVLDVHKRAGHPTSEIYELSIEGT